MKCGRVSLLSWFGFKGSYSKILKDVSKKNNLPFPHNSICDACFMEVMWDEEFDGEVEQSWSICSGDVPFPLKGAPDFLTKPLFSVPWLTYSLLQLLKDKQGK